MIGFGGITLYIGGLALAMPDTALQASLRGVSVWWDVLFPALFPFFVLSELLLGFGVVHMTGTLLDPLMRPLFRLPGVGGFVVAMGFASGYPVGARLTSRLLDQGLLTARQAERLVFMTTTSDPIFLIGAVCIGFFGSSEPAPVLAIAHYSAALMLGFLDGLLDREDTATPTKQMKPMTGGRLRAALAAMHRARLADGRPLGQLLQQSIQSSLSLMIIVGGLVVFFSAALDLFIQSGSLSFFNQMTAGMLQLFGLSPDMGPAIVKGTFEVTLGAKAAATEGASGLQLPLVHRIAAAAFVLSWAGLSVHAQVAGLMSRARWRYAPFLLFRLLHGVLAMLIVYIIWPFFF